METYILENDLRVFCVTARSFPDGVMGAFDKMHQLLPDAKERTFYGLSRPEHGTIVYKAAVEESYKGEAEKYGLETILIKKGTYLQSVIKDFMKDLPAIGMTFQQMITDPRIDPQGYCVEVYLNEKDVRCMVRLNPALVAQ